MACLYSSIAFVASPSRASCAPWRKCLSADAGMTVPGAVGFAAGEVGGCGLAGTVVGFCCFNPGAGCGCGASCAPRDAQPANNTRTAISVCFVVTLEKYIVWPASEPSGECYLSGDSASGGFGGGGSWIFETSFFIC